MQTEDEFSWCRSGTCENCVSVSYAGRIWTFFSVLFGLKQHLTYILNNIHPVIFKFKLENWSQLYSSKLMYLPPTDGVLRYLNNEWYSRCNITCILCMYHVCMYMYVCMYLYICIYAHIWILYTCRHACMYVCVHAHAYIVQACFGMVLSTAHGCMMKQFVAFHIEIV